MKNKDLNILFLCDAGYKSGMGHITRCITLAYHLTDIFKNTFFVSKASNGYINDLIEKNNFRYIQISHIENQLFDLVKEMKISLIVIDSYSFPIKLEKQLYELHDLTVFIIDDLFKKHFCHYLLNHNIHSLGENYRGLLPESCTIYAGSDYSLIRKSLRDDKKNLTQKDQHILICLGATDHLNLSPKIIDSLRKFTCKKIMVATTSANINVSDLLNKSSMYKDIHIEIDRNDIGQLLNDAEFAIISPSGIMLEAIYLNTLFIAINTADNQNRNVDFLNKNKLPVLNYKDINTIMRPVEELLNNKEDLANRISSLGNNLGNKLSQIKYELQQRFETPE